MYIFICVYVHCLGILPAPSGATGSDTGDVLTFLMQLHYHLCLPAGRFSICRNPEPLRAPELPCVCARCHPPPNAKGMDRAAAFPVARNLFERRSYRVTCHNTSTRELVFVLFQVPCVVALFMVFVCLFLYVGFFICSFLCLFVRLSVRLLVCFLFLVYLFLGLFICLSVCLFLFVCFNVRVLVCVFACCYLIVFIVCLLDCFCVYVCFLCLYVCLFVCLFVYMFIKDAKSEAPSPPRMS